MPPGRSGNVAPLARIAGAATGLNVPAGVALDATGRIYVANRAAGTVTRYPAGADANVAPDLTITAGLSTPANMAIDAAGALYVTNEANNTITRYTNGALVATISGGGLARPVGIALDASGRLAVTNFTAGRSITQFSTGGDLLNTIVGAATGLSGPNGIAAVPIVTVTTPSPLPDAGVGAAYSTTLAATGGTGPYTWALATGALPAGLSISSAGVVSGTPTTTGTASFSVSVTDAAAHASVVAMSLQVLPAAESNVWVANTSANTVTRYGPTATGNTAPAATISGAATGLNVPIGTVVDGSGRLYVANQTANTITQYAPGANGNVAPVATIGGALTQLAGPRALALDRAGRLYVTNITDHSVTVYAPGASGNVAPLARIAGAATGLNVPAGVALDATGRIYVANRAAGTVTRYPAGADANVAPDLTITAGLSTPANMAIDAAGALYVTNEANNTITRYTNGALVATISGGGLARPVGIALDASGRLAVTNFNAAVDHPVQHRGRPAEHHRRGRHQPERPGGYRRRADRDRHHPQPPARRRRRRGL